MPVITQIYTLLVPKEKTLFYVGFLLNLNHKIINNKIYLTFQQYLLLFFANNIFQVPQYNFKNKKELSNDSSLFWMQQQPIFPDRLQSSIVGASELNYCVRYENRWDLTANVTAMVYNRSLCVYLLYECIYILHSFESSVKFFTR